MDGLIIAGFCTGLLIGVALGLNFIGLLFPGQFFDLRRALEKEQCLREKALLETQNINDRVTEYKELRNQMQEERLRLANLYDKEEDLLEKWEACGDMLEESFQQKQNTLCENPV